nr:MAG TPA: hypothetical protein [Caudoviricetes sp.]
MPLLVRKAGSIPAGGFPGASSHRVLKSSCVRESGKKRLLGMAVSFFVCAGDRQ